MATVDDEPLDLVTQAITKTGCLSLHHSVQECMFEHKDWRRCQKELQAFRKCIEEHNTNNPTRFFKKSESNEQ